MSNELIQRLDVKFFDNALCAESDPDAFFPDPGDSANKAKAICYFCTNRKECLDYALLIDDRWAIMGGLTPRARRALRKGHKRKVAEGTDKGLTSQEIANQNGFAVAYVEKLMRERSEVTKPLWGKNSHLKVEVA